MLPMLKAHVTSVRCFDSSRRPDSSKILTPLALLLLLGPFLMSGCRAQSFSCAAARKADEATICQNPRLSSLDSELALAFRNALRDASPRSATTLTDDQARWLRTRYQCGINTSCIEDLYAKRIEELKGFAKNTPLKISVGAHAGDATVLKLERPDTDNVVAYFRRELDDLVEDCTRNIPPDENGVVDSQKVASCVKDASRRENGHVYKRRARCSIATIYTEFGNFTMVHTEKETESNSEGKKYKPIRTDWKDHRTEQLAGNCSGCNTPQMLSTFQVLCPAAYKSYFDGLDPY